MAKGGAGPICHLPKSLPPPECRGKEPCFLVSRCGWPGALTPEELGGPSAPHWASLAEPAPESC